MPTDKRGDFGLWIKAKRTEKGLTLQSVSDALGYKAIGPINNLERGIATVPVERIHPLARALGIPVEEILDKIRECEPDLFEKYQTLRKDIARHLILGNRPGLEHELSLHHLPFPGNGLESDNLSYVARGAGGRSSFVRHDRGLKTIYYVNYLDSSQNDKPLIPFAFLADYINPDQLSLFPEDLSNDPHAGDTGICLH